MGQLNENDNNKNRKYKVIDQRVGDTFARTRRRRTRTPSRDVYVKFFRWAIDRLQGRDGIVCFVQQQRLPPGHRLRRLSQAPRQEFDLIYHFNFRGNARTAGEQRRRRGRQYLLKPHSDERRNLCARPHRSKHDASINYHAVADYLPRRQKLIYLRAHQGISSVDWEKLVPDAKGNWVSGGDEEAFAVLLPLGTKDADNERTIFGLYGCGVASNGDAYVYDYDGDKLHVPTQRMVEDFNTQLDRWKRSGEPEDLDGFLQVDEKVHKWIRNTKRTLKRGKHVSFRR